MADTFPTSETLHTDDNLNASHPVTGSHSKRSSIQVPSPPYWQHQRTASTFSQSSLPGSSAITLSDNTEASAGSATQDALWAKTVSISDYVIVRGNPTGLGAYVVWTCTVQTLDGGPMTISKRYSEFDELRQQLLKDFPQSTKRSLPPLPPKSAIYKFRPAFLEKRRQGLQYFLTCVMLNPEYAGSEAVKDFILRKEQ